MFYGSIIFRFITKKYNYNHSSWLEGQDSIGNIQKFQYYGFGWIDKYAKIGDYFATDSNDLKFVLTNDSIRYTFYWDCSPQNQSLEIDTLLPLPRYSF